MKLVEVEGAVEHLSPDLSAAGVRFFKVENDELDTAEKRALGSKRLIWLSHRFDKHVAATILPLMDQGLANDEIRALVGNLKGIGSLRRKWEGEARRTRAHARVTAGPSRPKNTIDGATLLQEVHEFVGRFVAYPSAESHVAHTLWLAHCHAMDAWDSTPARFPVPRAWIWKDTCS